MEDTSDKLHIKPKVKREIIILFTCIVASLGLHIYSYLKVDKILSGIIQEMEIVLLIGLAIYFLVLTFRLLFYGMLKLTKRNLK